MQFPYQIPKLASSRKTGNRTTSYVVMRRITTAWEEIENLGYETRTSVTVAVLLNATEVSPCVDLRICAEEQVLYKKAHGTYFSLHGLKVLGTI